VFSNQVGYFWYLSPYLSCSHNFTFRMAVLNKGKSLFPFWGTSINLIMGLDPLGLQTTSEATYSSLFPGISNLTNRLRYYGFYCWLLDFYFQREKKGNSTEQYRFIRRAELMIAIMMQSQRKNVQQITGSNFATNLIATAEDDYFDLADGADRDDPSKTTYWKYPSGAFGQYYSGAMQTLALINTAINEDGDIIYTISQPHQRQKVSGVQLAEAFDSTLTHEIKELFYTNIKTGKLYHSDIPELIAYYSIDVINPDSDEWDLYAEMLLDKDEPSQEIEELFTFSRRETILSLLRLASLNDNKYDWYQFLLSCYLKKLGNDSEPASETHIGWYCYQLNEYWQFACGAIFWAVLQNLYHYHQDQYLPHFVNELSAEIYDEICRGINVNPEDSVIISDVVARMPEGKTEEEIKESIETRASDNPIIAAKNGFLLLFQIYRNNKEQLHPLKEFMSRKQIIRDGNMVDGIMTIHTAKKEELKSFIEQFILRNIIYRHQMVAIRKMGNGTQATHKFIIEEQYIRFIEIFPPRNTSPRMFAMQNIMHDLQVIDEKNMLSQLCQKLLSE